MLPLIIAQYEFLIQLCHCHVIRIIHNTGRSVCGRLQQSFQNKPAYFNYHPVGLIIAVILDVPVDVIDDGTPTLNLKVAQDLNITIPDDVLKQSDIAVKADK